MGFFRTKKIDRYTEEQLEDKVVWARIGVLRAVGDRFLDVDEALQEWAEWREALARKQGQNKSPLDK